MMGMDFQVFRKTADLSPVPGNHTRLCTYRGECRGPGKDEAKR
jgi:hypothetical protein